MPLEARLRQYRELVHRYHPTLDLVSDAGLAKLDDLIDQARTYANVISDVAPSGTILDLGSGAGLPGVVIAATLPHRHVLLVERRRRRVAFLRIVVGQLALRKARVIEADVRALKREDLDDLLPADADLLPLHARGGAGARGGSGTAASGSPGAVHVLTAQAVGALTDVYCLSRHLHADLVTVLVRKGADWQAEVDLLAAALDLAPAVRAARSLGDGGSLIAIEVPGGISCPRSA